MITHRYAGSFFAQAGAGAAAESHTEWAQMSQPYPRRPRFWKAVAYMVLFVLVF
jgi:hypothetical protein